MCSSYDFVFCCSPFSARSYPEISSSSPIRCIYLNQRGLAILLRRINFLPSQHVLIVLTSFSFAMLVLTSPCLAMVVSTSLCVSSWWCYRHCAVRHCIVCVVMVLSTSLQCVCRHGAVDVIALCVSSLWCRRHCNVCVVVVVSTSLCVVIVVSTSLLVSS